MRRDVLELPEHEMGKLGEYTAELSTEVESLEVMHHVRHGTAGSAVVCRVKPKENFKGKVGELSFRFKKFEVLSEQRDGIVLYLEAETAPLSTNTPNPPKVYLNFPFEISGGHRRVTFLGDEAEIEKLFRWLGKNRVKFEVLSNTDARYSPNSFMDGLTDQQRKALTLAYSSGYYELPRKVNLESLAKRQKLNKSTFAEHLLKAENYLISRMMESEPGAPSHRKPA